MHRLFAIALVALLSVATASANFFYGVGDDSNIYEFNAGTGTSLLVYETGFSSGQSNAVAWDEGNGNLFFRTPDNGVLYAWNRASNTLASLGDPGNGTANATFGANAYWFVLDGTDDLYKSTFTYDTNGIPVTRTTTLAFANFDGPLTNSFGFGDIAYRSVDNSIYGSSNRGLWKFDVGTAVFTMLNASFTTLRQIAWSADGNTLFAHNHNNGAWSTISTTTWTESPLGSPQIQSTRLRDIDNASATSAVPEPGTLSMLGLAGLLLAVGTMRRRKV
ncbi:MAG: PEP-CTERM sorting domain-containing protein [Bryobacterales bacterium]|jgi:hypothetical protein|nr:PEP-CTERM sorting domain-containing protein [Bryobacterales bacterium]